MLNVLFLIVIAVATYYLIVRKHKQAGGSLTDAAGDGPLDPLRRLWRHITGGSDGGPPTQQP